MSISRAKKSAASNTAKPGKKATARRKKAAGAAGDATETRTTYHHGDLREALIAETMVMLGETGAEGLSLRRLAARLGVSHNAPYMHFPNREALLAAVAEQGFKDFSAHITSVKSPPDADWTTRFIHACQAYVRFGLKHPELLELMFMQHDSEAYPDMHTESMSAFHLLENAVAQGQAEGAIAPGDSRFYASTIWSLIHGITVLTARRDTLPTPYGKRAVDDLVERMLLQLLHGIAP